MEGDDDNYKEPLTDDDEDSLNGNERGVSPTILGMHRSAMHKCHATQFFALHTLQFMVALNRVLGM